MPSFTRVLLASVAALLLGAGCGDSSTACCPITDEPGTGPVCIELGGAGPSCAGVCDLPGEDFLRGEDEAGCPIWYSPTAACDGLPRPAGGLDGGVCSL